MSRRPQLAMVTVEEFYRFPDDGTRLELVAGRVVSEPLPGFAHGRLLIRFAVLLDAHVRASSLGTVVGGDAGFILARSPDTLRGPDVAYVSAARVGGNDPLTAFDGPPDLAVEVVSPSDGPDAVRAKVAEYLAAGTRLVWVVDPETETVTVYRKLLGPRTLEKGDVLEGEDVVPGFHVEVKDLFAK